MKRKISLFLLAALLLVTALGGCSSDKTGSDVELATYTPGSTENEYYRLDVDDNGLFTLTAKENGYVISSCPAPGVEGEYQPPLVKSALKMQVYTPESGETVTLDSDSYSTAAGGLSVERGAQEIVATYAFADMGMTVPVHYTLYGRRLAITVIPDEIQTTKGNLLESLALHPYFGSGNATQEGFLVVPDGSGALIEFNRGVGNTYSQKVYGPDQSLYRVSQVEHTQPVVMPVFGIGRTGEGLSLGIITGGAGDASVEAEAGNGETGYNAVWASFNLLPRDVRHYDDVRMDVDIVAEEIKDTGMLQVTYTLEQTEAPTYTRLAEIYRHYLVETYGLTPLTEETSPLALDLVAASVKTKSLLGIPYDGVQTLTSFEKGRQIIEDFASQEIPTALRLSGWSSQTVWGKPLDGAGMPGGVGSKSDLRALLQTAAENGKVYLFGNLSEVYSGGGLFPKTHAYAKDMRGAAATYQHFNLVTRFREESGHYLLSNANVLKYTRAFGETVSDLAPNTGVGLDGLGNMYTDFGAEQQSMTATVRTYEAALSSLQEQGADIAVSGGNAFSLAAADFIYWLPSESSGFDVASDSIPFYQIALHGLIPYSSEPVNLSPDPQKAFLKAMETGSLLAFQFIAADADAARYSRNDTLYSASYDRWKEIAMQQYKEWAAVMGDKLTMRIVDHSRLADDVYRTVYENGDAVTVNYSSVRYDRDGLTVEPLAYCFEKGEP